VKRALILNEYSVSNQKTRIIAKQHHVFSFFKNTKNFFYFFKTFFFKKKVKKIFFYFLNFIRIKDLPPTMYR